MSFDKIIKKRKSVRRFSVKKPDWRDIIEAVESARHAPMAGNIYSVKFVIVEDPIKIKKIAEACQQDFIAEAQYVVVVCTDPTKTENSYPEMAQRFLNQQAGAAIQNFLLKIVDTGLSSCWIGYFEESLIKETIKAKKKNIIEAVLPIGYESKVKEKRSQQREKVDLDVILRFEKYSQKKMDPARKIEGRGTMMSSGFGREI